MKKISLLLILIKLAHCSESVDPFITNGHSNFGDFRNTSMHQKAHKAPGYNLYPKINTTALGTDDPNSRDLSYPCKDTFIYASCMVQVEREQIMGILPRGIKEIIGVRSFLFGFEVSKPSSYYWDTGPKFLQINPHGCIWHEATTKDNYEQVDKVNCTVQTWLFSGEQSLGIGNPRKRKHGEFFMGPRDGYIDGNGFLCNAEGERTKDKDGNDVKGKYQFHTDCIEENPTINGFQNSICTHQHRPNHLAWSGPTRYADLSPNDCLDKLLFSVVTIAEEQLANVSRENLHVLPKNTVIVTAHYFSKSESWDFNTAFGNPDWPKAIQPLLNIIAGNPMQEGIRYSHPQEGIPCPAAQIAESVCVTDGTINTSPCNVVLAEVQSITTNTILE